MLIVLPKGEPSRLAWKPLEEIIVPNICLKKDRTICSDLAYGSVVREESIVTLLPEGWTKPFESYSKTSYVVCNAFLVQAISIPLKIS